MLHSVILAASHSRTVERLVETVPLSRAVVRRFVAGTTVADAVRTTTELVADGLSVTLDCLGEDTTQPSQAQAVARDYCKLLAVLAGEGLTVAAEVSVKLSALGQRFDRVGSVAYAAEICQAATDAGTTVTLDMEDHSTTDATLEALSELRRDFPNTGAVLQSHLRRTEADCRDLAYAGSRVRLCKGAYAEPESVAYWASREINRSYVRCINLLLAGGAYPMFATHDPTLVAIAQEQAAVHQRELDSFEFQMLYGVRPREQRRLVRAGYTTRLYIPFGTQWYGYLMRRLAERPANLAFFLRALLSRQ